MTFLILGDICTRTCSFCGVKKGCPEEVDKEEPKRLAAFVENIGLDYIIITSVTRDDLTDGGAKQFSDCISEIRTSNKNVKIELLTSDFKGDTGCLKDILKKRPDVFAHNIETVPRLYKKLRPEADYQRSLNTLRKAHEFNPLMDVKSGIMVGLGEREEEVFEVMADLKKAGCNSVAIGQYLRPSKEQTEVNKFIRPAVFDRYKTKANTLGFEKVSSGPFVRSS